MKCLISLLMATFLPMALGAENFFKEGTKWVVHEYASIYPPELVNSRKVISLEKYADGENKSLGFYYSYTPDVETTVFSEPQFFAYVKVEGNKVYFKPNRPNANEWLLLYDFDLKPGEGAYHYLAWGIVNPSNPDPQRTYLKCVGIDVDPNYPEWEMMSFEEYFDESCEVRLNGLIGPKYWIKGLSSVRGVTWNSGLELDGGGATLLEVTCGDRIIYKDKAASIQEVGNPTPVKIRVDGLTLSVSDASGLNSMSVYTPSGTLIAQTELTAAPIGIVLPQSGVYILKIGSLTYKIVGR